SCAARDDRAAPAAGCDPRARAGAAPRRRRMLRRRRDLRRDASGTRRADPPGQARRDPIDRRLRGRAGQPRLRHADRRRAAAGGRLDAGPAPDRAARRELPAPDGIGPGERGRGRSVSIVRTEGGVETTQWPNALGGPAAAQARILERLRTLVEQESPSGDVARVSALALEVAAMLETAGLEVDRIEAPGYGINLRARLEGAEPELEPVVVLAHLDTVHPVGTLERQPFRVVGDRAEGPGIYDRSEERRVGEECRCRWSPRHPGVQRRRKR